MTGRFANQTVLITGASAGIGAALARAFAQEGANLALTARRADKLEAVKGEVEALGIHAFAIPCDVTQRADLDAAVAQTVETFGGLDVVVANAGFGVSGLFQDLDTDDYRRQFDTNVFGLIDTVYAALPHLIKSKGRVALVSSVMGRMTKPGFSAYCSSKFAVTGLAESLHFDLADTGVSVTLISPGLVESDFRVTDNAGRVHEDAPDPAPQWLVMPAAKAARQIVRAIDRRQFELVVTAHGKVLMFLVRHFPRTMRWLTPIAMRD